MIQPFFTKEPKWLDRWDTYLQQTPQGSYILLSDWVKSYASYGFDNELCLFVKNDTIVGGFNAVVAKVAFFKFYIVPYGPIATDNDSAILNVLVAKVAQRAAEIKACYCQINLPFLSDETDISALQDFQSGQLFKYVFALNGLNWIDLKNYSEAEALLLDFKSSVRRDIRSSIRKGLSVAFLSDENEIKKAYDLCVANASERNYAIRDWKDVQESILNLIEKNYAKFIVAYKDGEMKGAIFIVKAGNYYNYLFGGTKKEKPDLLVGHFLQWEALKLSLEEHRIGYNISLGGSQGVIAFKNSFNATEVLFQNSKHYKVINSFLFSFFLYFEKYIKPYKKTIAKVLSYLKK